MDLETIKLNRFIYRNQNTPVTENPVYMSADQNSLREVDFNKGTFAKNKDAREIVTGTVITACLIKSSDQDDRIEIGQNLDSVQNFDFGDLQLAGAKGLDYLVAYRPGGRIGFILTGVGMVYVGFGMPAVKCINLRNNQAEVIQTTSEQLWTMTTLGPGEYRVNHNLNSLDYSANATPTTVSGGTTFYANISDKGLNSFIVNILNLLGGSEASDFDCTVQIFK